MEVSGLVLAITALTDPIIRLGNFTSTSWSHSNSFGADVEKLRLRLKRGKRQIEAIKGLLLTKVEGLGEADTTIFEQFDALWQNDLLDELRQLRALTRDLEEIETLYHVFNQAVSATMPDPASSLRTQLDTLTIDDREVLLQHRATTRQLLKWGVRDAKRTAKLLNDLEHWIELFKDDVQMLESLRENPNVAALGLQNAIQLRQTLLETVDPRSRQLQLDRAPQLSSRLSANSALGTYRDQIVFIEYKSYDPHAENSVLDRVRFQVCQLAALLTRVPPSSEDAEVTLRTLQCIGFWIEPLESRYAFVYKIPPNIRPEPISLLSILTAGEQRCRSTVRHRLQLAYSLAVSLYQLQLVGWVHKSIRSENIIFLPSGNPPSNQPSSPAILDALTDRRTHQTYDYPYIVGFDYSRVHSGDSSLSAADTSLSRNIYRHPDRWNVPTARFDFVHDIYALGTVLLEIGLWKPLISLSSTGFSQATDAAVSADNIAAAAAKEAVREQLLQYASRRLPFTLGRTYCEAVELCLHVSDTGELDPQGFGVDESDHAALGKAFREKIVEPLGRAAKTL